MPARHIHKNEEVQTRQIMALSFQFPFDEEEFNKKEQLEVTPHEHAPSWNDAWGFFDEEGKMLATFDAPVYRIRYEGRDVEMTGIGGVASRAETRRGGNIKAIFRALFAEQKAKNIPFSVLYPFSHRYYRQYGYELCHILQQTCFPTEAFKDFGAGVEAVFLQKGADFQPVKAVYDEFIKDMNLAAARSEAYWKSLMDRDPYKERTNPYLLYKDGKAVAYLTWRAEEGSEPILLVTDCAYIGREGLYALLGFLYRFAGNYKNTKINLPPEVEPISLLQEQWTCSMQRKCSGMARIVDVRSALEWLRCDGEFTVFVRDEFLPENTGTYRVGPDTAEKISCADENADLCCTVQTLCQICLGVIDMQAAAYKPDVEVRGNRSLLWATFRRKNVYLADAF